MPQQGFLDRLLGMGYAGACKAAGVWLPVLPSQVAEEAELAKADAGYSTSPYGAVGAVPVRNRRRLRIQLAVPLCKASAFLLDLLFLGWRNYGASGPPSAPLSLRYAAAFGGMAYDAAEAFPDTLQLAAQDGQLVQLSLGMTAWTWTRSDATEAIGPDGAAFDPTLADYVPVPHWRARLAEAPVAGDALGWSASFSNNLAYKQLLEGYSNQPPNPRLVLAGPLEATLQATVLAETANRPAETGSALARLSNRLGDEVLAIRWPSLVLDGSTEVTGFGSANQAYQRQASWYAYGERPRVEQA